jgi:dTDP-4-amino-4,6-dideoxygalactose transaminase
MQTFVPAECDRGGLLRFPIAFPEGHRTKILRRALEQGLYLETNFVHPLPKASEHAAFPNAVWAAKELILLPLYTRLPVNAARQIVDTLLNVGFQH